MCCILKVSIWYWRKCLSPGQRSPYRPTEFKTESHTLHMTQPTHCRPLTRLFTFPITFVGHPCSLSLRVKDGWSCNDACSILHHSISFTGDIYTFVSCTSFILVAVWFASGAYNGHCEGQPTCQTLEYSCSSLRLRTRTHQEQYRPSDPCRFTMWQRYAVSYQ
jgi:hypothetical protein